MAGAIVGIALAGRAKTGVYFIQFPDGSITHTKKEVTDVTSGKNAIPVRSRVHFDFDPIDEDGMEVGPGDVRLNGFYVDAFCAEGAIDLNQTGPDDPDHGCTPVAKCNGEVVFSIRAYAMVDGQKRGAEVNTPNIRVS